MIMGVVVKRGLFGACLGFFLLLVVDLVPSPSRWRLKTLFFLLFFSSSRFTVAREGDERGGSSSSSSSSDEGEGEVDEEAIELSLNSLANGCSFEMSSVLVSTRSSSVFFPRLVDEDRGLGFKVAGEVDRSWILTSRTVEF